MSESTYVIGSVITHKGSAWRVVRIVGRSETLFEPEDGRTVAYVGVESYVQLKSVEGLIDFVVLTADKMAYDGPNSVIKGVEPIMWNGAR